MFGIPALDAAASAAVSGGAIGAGTGFIDGLTKQQLLRRALIGGGASGLMAGSAIGVGHKLLGEPDDDSSFTRSGAVGGGLVGSLAGGGLGASLASGLIPAERGLLKKIARMGMGKAAGAGALLGAVVGGYQGSDEGMQLDFIKNEIERRHKDRLRRQMNGEV